MTSNIDPRHGDGRETSPSLREEDTCKPSATRKEHPKFTTVPPPLRAAKGDASAASRGMPEFHPKNLRPTSSPQAIRHSRKPSVIPASHPSFPRLLTSFPRTREPRSKTKHTISTHNIKPPQNPLPQHQTSPFSAVPQTTNNVSPLPRAIPLPLPRGRLRGGPRVRATGRPWGAAPPKPPTPSLTENTLDNPPPQHANQRPKTQTTQPIFFLRISGPRR